MATAIRTNLPDYCVNDVVRWNVNRMLIATRALIVGLLVAVVAMPSARAEDGVLVLGRVSDDPNSHYAGMKLLLAHQLYPLILKYFHLPLIIHYIIIL